MAVTLAKELTSDQRVCGLNAAGEFEYTRVFSVHTDDGRTPQKEILTYPALPQWGDPYRVPGFEDATTRAFSFSASSNKAHDKWIVIIKYTSRPPVGRGGPGGAGSAGDKFGFTPDGSGNATPEGGGPGGDPPPGGQPPAELQWIQNPLDRPAEIDFSTYKVKRIAKVDVAQVPIVNSANDPFDPPIEFEDVQWQISITKNRARFDPQALKPYLQAINSTTFLGYPQYSLLLEDIKSKRASENGIYYWTVTFEFLHNSKLWYPLKVLDAGYNQYENILDESYTVAIEDKYGNATSRPVRLDGSGYELDANAPSVFLEFDFYEEKDFRDLKLF